MSAIIRRLLGNFPRDQWFPFELEELERADARADALFRKSFHAPAPDIPRHFVAVHKQQRGLVAGYVHYTVYEPGIFLLGGLCVDPASYRVLKAEERRSIAAEGSLARWLIKRSIERLGPTLAVFGFTGDTRSRRDTRALGFIQAAEPFLIVQWHSQPLSARPGLIEKIAALGPF